MPSIIRDAEEILVIRAGTYSPWRVSTGHEWFGTVSPSIMMQFERDKEAIRLAATQNFRPMSDKILLQRDMSQQCHSDLRWLHFFDARRPFTCLHPGLFIHKGAR